MGETWTDLVTWPYIPHILNICPSLVLQHAASEWVLVIQTYHVTTRQLIYDAQEFLFSEHIFQIKVKKHKYKLPNQYLACLYLLECLFLIVIQIQL